MSVSAPLTSAPTPKECPSGSPTTVEVDTSGSLPLFLMLVAGVFWLCLGSALGLIASVKLHAPAMLSGIPALTYGRLIPAQNALFLYGFAAQVGLGIALWIVSRLGRAKVVAPFILTVGALLWNVGILTGLLNILAGNWTGLNAYLLGHASLCGLRTDWNCRTSDLQGAHSSRSLPFDVVYSRVVVLVSVDLRHRFLFIALGVSESLRRPRDRRLVWSKLCLDCPSQSGTRRFLLFYS